MIDALPPNWIYTGLSVLIGGALLSALVHWAARSLDAGRHGWSRAVRRRLGVLPERRIGEVRWVGLAIQISLWPLLGYVLLRLWELDELGHDFVDTLLGTGIKVGAGTTIVPGQLLLGLVAFLLLMTFTRWFKRKLERDWLPLTQMEPSLRLSVATLFGYVTFIIALMVGLSAAGLDLSKIALVAGALSVGIGFGLQNIVNNFVSGLILLFERPVRVGDYIKVGSTSGYVRSIRIRSTEIENDERASVIVPNSTLLQAEVENWNYRSNLGRVVIGFNVSHGTNPEQMRQLLVDAAVAHPQVFKQGEMSTVLGPSVALKDVSETSMRFELTAGVRNINAKGGVASDLRFEVMRRIRESDPPIAFPQTTVWMREGEPGDAKSPAASDALPRA
ncbi:MAG: mechanosensitive ion channel family protein [Panacagrimonas sp.]